MVACRRGDIVAGMTDSSFVATMTALTRINLDLGRDSASRAASRDSVLQSKDLTPEDLERAARALEDDPERALALWLRITREGTPGAATPGPAIVR